MHNMAVKSLLRDINNIIYPITTVDSIYDNKNGEKLDSIILKKQDKCLSEIITIPKDKWSNEKIYIYESDKINNLSTIFWELVRDENYSYTKICKISCDDQQDQNKRLIFKCAKIPKYDIKIKIALF